MGKMTIEVDTDKLSCEGMVHLRKLLDETFKKVEVEPDWTRAPESVLNNAATKLVTLLRREPNGNQLRLIQAYVTKGETRLTAEELVAAAQKEGPALAGVLSSLTRNWRKAGMPGRRGITYKLSYPSAPVVGYYSLADDDMSVWKAIEKAVKP